MKKYLLLFVFLFLFSPVQAEEPMGWIEIPSISLYRPIYNIELVDRNYNLDDLGYGLGKVGYLNQNEWGHWIHDELGKVILVGHTPGAFENLTQVQIGDSIIVGDDNGVVEYVVLAIHIVEVTETDWLGTSDSKVLLLQTCYGTQRLLIEAIPNNQKR